MEQFTRPSMPRASCRTAKLTFDLRRRWEFQGKHKDGSLRVDIPLHSLHLLYNVNFSVVSQVNPHIHLFHFAPRGAPGRPVSHRKGKGWRGGFLLSAAEQFLKIELTKNFRVAVVGHVTGNES